MMTAATRRGPYMHAMNVTDCDALAPAPAPALAPEDLAPRVVGMDGPFEFDPTPSSFDDTPIRNVIATLSPVMPPPPQVRTLIN